MSLAQSFFHLTSVFLLFILSLFAFVHFHHYFNICIQSNDDYTFILSKNCELYDKLRNLIDYNDSSNRSLIFSKVQNNSSTDAYKIQDFEQLWSQLQRQQQKNENQDEIPIQNFHDEKQKVQIELPSMNQTSNKKQETKPTISQIYKGQKGFFLKQNDKISHTKLLNNITYIESVQYQNFQNQPLQYQKRKLAQSSHDASQNQVHEQKSSNQSVTQESDLFLQKQHYQNNTYNSNQNINNTSQLQHSYDTAYIALCLIAKQEHKFIKEWVMYHHYIGVDKFYIYDHGSDPPMQPLVQKFIDSGLVQYEFFTTEWQNDTYKLNEQSVWFNGVRQINSPQRWVHSDCFVKNHKKHQFMAMIDIDEFIVLNQGRVGGQRQGQGTPQAQGQNSSSNQGQESWIFLPVENPHLPTFLKQYENYGGLVVYWRIYGSSGLEKSPQKGVLASYTNCQHKEISGTSWTDIKHIVNTKYMGSVFCVIHGCLTTKQSVTSDHKEKQIWQNKIHPVWNKININHYMIKSWEDYEGKRARGGGHSPVHIYSGWRNKRFFQNTDAFAPGNCTFMQQVADKCCQ
eukprot:TRINITY_DN12518_c0_g2_i1.p1 TRINITY_DN12518_c0_g2~~TRINITY_DN12518_c0_g2_i1.p1  ORF type:complete len:569 (-),score=8.98 TRINITY_DN12518_c0_g2_i1:362-2068(-)